MGCVIEGFPKACFELVELNIGCAKACIDVCQLARDPVLLSLEKIERYSTGIVRLQESGPFVGQSLFLRFQMMAFPLRLLA
ncbi:hypothetical protein [Mycobacterium saskatchewanense]|uniref:hypothetical protein n=1 Tax=Mycobacterium saskatchewanense TaxID=220927 RepID=UPI0013D2BED7|nr:hypothetical protein [Mycobacterium saskatchewanense]